MRKKGIALTTIVALLCAPALFAANAPALSAVSCAPSLTTVSCPSPSAPVKVTAKVPSTGASAGVYFKAAGEQNEYYVDMHRSPNDDTMWAFIPAPEPTTPSFTYRVVAMDVSGVQVATPIATATVMHSCSSPVLTAEQQRAASNIVIGLTTPTQSPIPPGFQCRGIVSYVASNGDLRPNDECRRYLASGGQSGATTSSASTGSSTSGTTASGTTGSAANGATNATTSAAAGNGGTAATTGAGGTSMGAPVGGGIALSSGTMIALTAAGLVGAGAIIVHNNHKNNSTQVSQSRP